MKLNRKLTTTCLLGLMLAASGCGRLGLGPGPSMERYANERYQTAMRLMDAGRFELAKEEFTVAEKSALSPELRQSAKDGRLKAEAIIEAKR